MTEGLSAALALPGIEFVFFAAILGGVVRGFSGFGAGMIFITISGIFLDPIATVVALQIMDGIGGLTLLPRGIREGEPKQVALLVLATALSIPLGLYVLVNVESEPFRWAVALLILALLIAMISGWRYRARLRPVGTVGVGIVAGFLSGFSGLAGPPVIMMYMSGPYRPEVIRANIILFFAAITVVAVVLLWSQGLLTPVRIWTGLILVIPYALATLLGQKIFDPSREREFRLVAYIVIFGSVVLSLPLWS